MRRSQIPSVRVHRAQDKTKIHVAICIVGPVVSVRPSSELLQEGRAASVRFVRHTKREYVTKMYARANVRGGFYGYSRLLNTRSAFNSAWALRMHGIGGSGQPASQAAKHHHSFLTKSTGVEKRASIGWDGPQGQQLPASKTARGCCMSGYSVPVRPCFHAPKNGCSCRGGLRHMGTKRRVERSWVLV